MSNVESKEDKLFRKMAWYSVHPTLEETGIGIGGFKKPRDVFLNVDVGDFAILHSDDKNDGKIVEIIKYAGEKPWWKGHLFVEGEGPCWIVASLKGTFEVDYSDSTKRLMEKMPIPDHMLEKVNKPITSKNR